MEKRGFLHRQVRCIGDQFNGTGYKNKLVGNSPELMPQDNNLFSDMKRALDWNVVATKHLPEDHPSKFSRSTPKRLNRSLLLTHQYSPCSARIVQDIDRSARAVGQIIKAGGRPIKFQGDRRGYRDGLDGPEVGEKRRRRSKYDVMMAMGRHGHPLARAEVEKRLGVTLPPPADDRVADPHLISDLYKTEGDSDSSDDELSDNSDSDTDQDFDENSVADAASQLAEDDDVYLPGRLRQAARSHMTTRSAKRRNTRSGALSTSAERTTTTTSLADSVDVGML